ncbi:MAG: cytochrome P450, partial [Anaerolineae bacterium]
ESIRLFTPAYVIGRQPASDLLCVVKNKQGEEVFREKIAQKEGILSMPTFAGRDPTQYEKPDEFNPHRFKDLPKTLPWLPFADGKHSCPGQWLAKAEVLALITALVQKYEIKSFPEKEIRQKGYMTLKPAEDVWLTLTERLP